MPEGVDSYSEIRSEQDSNILWLEDFRLNLIDTSSAFSYSISEVEYGVETVYNLIGSVGPKITSNSSIYKDSIELQVQNGLLNGNRIKTLSSHIFSMMEDYVFQNDKGFLFVDINAEDNGSLAKFHISLIAADISEPDSTAALVSYCTEDYFSSPDCFRSAVGNPKIGSQIYDGGPCNDINDETSAQVEVETAIQHDIPRVIYHSTWGAFGVIEGYIRYTNPDREDFYFPDDLGNLSSSYANCSALKLDFKDNNNTLSEIEYETDRLNCTLCILYDYIESIKPNDKEICDITIWGDLLIGVSSSSEIHWFGEVVFCDAEVVKLKHPGPQEPAPAPTPTDFLGSLSILDLFENE
nr:hypothetical protein [Saprospiraceae bacterium]